MPVIQQPYVESVENFARGSISSVNEDRSDVESFYEDDDNEYHIGSIPGNLHIPHFPSRKRSPPPHRMSDPLPVHGSISGYPTSDYASSEPPPNLYGGRREGFPKDRGHHDDRKNRVHTKCKQRYEKCLRKAERYRVAKKAAEQVAETKSSENESLRIRLFHSLKDSKKYDDAEKLYYETVAGREPAKSEDTVILDVRHSFAEILIEQKRFQEAEPISRSVWEKGEHSQGPPSELFKKSHRQLCSVLCAVSKHKDAEKMHMQIYQREKMDEWALENGDEVCQRRREQGDIKRAKEMQDEVWKERLKRHGPKDGLTIRSGLRLIEFLEELVATPGHQGGTDAERRLSISHKQAFECEIEVILREIWSTRLQPESNTDRLTAGHKLGDVLFRQNRFSDAGAIFEPVWEDKKQRLGDSNVSTMSTGSMLGKALYHQGNQESYLKAANVFHSIWISRQTVMNGDAKTISSGEDLALTYWSLEKWLEAEHAYAWILQQKERKAGYSTGEIDDARWNLGQTLWKQGKAKERKAETVLRELYHRWKATSPSSNLTLECGQMLAQTVSTQEGKIDDALSLALDVFNGRGAVARKGVAYLDSGRLYGSLLLKIDRFAEAEKTLKSVWEFQAREAEQQRMRFRCGHLYGQALVKRQRYFDARKVLDAVAAGQEAILPAGAPEIVETRQLLEKVIRLGKGKPRVKQNSYRRGALATILM